MAQESTSADFVQREPDDEKLPNRKILCTPAALLQYAFLAESVNAIYKDQSGNAVNMAGNPTTTGPPSARGITMPPNKRKASTGRELARWTRNGCGGWNSGSI